MAVKFHFSTTSTLLKAGAILFTFAFFDTIFTDFGIRNDYIEEANPIMRVVYETSITAFYLVKISLPLILLFLISKIKPKPYFSLLIGATLLLYFFVICTHVFWLILVIRIA